MPQEAPPDKPVPPGSGPFDCRVLHDRAGAVVVAASGEIDLATKAALHSALAPLLADERALLLDLSQVTFIDCAGLRVLQAAHLARRRFAVVAPSVAVTRLLELSGARVTVLGSAQEAISVLGPSPQP